MNGFYFFTLYHTFPSFNDAELQAFPKNNLGKVASIFFFFFMFSIPPKRERKKLSSFIPVFTFLVCRCFQFGKAYNKLYWEKVSRYFVVTINPSKGVFGMHT